VKTALKGIFGFLLLAVLGYYFLVLPPSPPEHRVFINGQVLSMDVESRVFEAISVKGERIHRLGSNAEIQALVDGGTEVTDLQGRTLMPGFVDAHGHFPGSGLTVVSADLNSPPIGTVTTMAELQERLREQLPGKSDDKWLSGFGYDDTLLAEKRHPNRDDLDAVSTEVPIYITHVSGHMGIGNSRALELLDITAESENPEGGVIARRPGSREPEGRLEETAHMQAAMVTLDFSAWDGIRMILAATTEYASMGVTTAQSGGVDRSLASGIAGLSNAGLIHHRVVLFPFYDSLGDEWIKGEFDPAEMSTDKIILGPVKVVADGSIQGYTGYLSEPYHAPYHGDAEFRGYPAIPRDKLIEIVSDFHGAGLQLAIHGNGDASIDDILNAFELAQAENPAEDPRLVVIHSQMAREDQLQKMLELGVTPSFFSAHTYYWGDRHWNIFMGPERAARMSPTRSAENLGLRYSVHLDTPVVPMQPMQMVWSTVNRISTGGNVIGAEQRVSPMAALRATTIDAAWQVFQEGSIGSLESGKFADMIILDGDPLTAEDVRDIQVVETIVGGSTIYLR
jgi:predicted amidohydrolase YtcJ